MSGRYRIIASGVFLVQLEQASDYIRFDLQSPMTAEETLKDVWKRVSILSMFPFSYPAVDSEVRSPIGLRKMPVRHLLLYYHVEDDVVYLNHAIYARANQEQRIVKGSMDLGESSIIEQEDFEISPVNPKDQDS